MRVHATMFSMFTALATMAAVLFSGVTAQARAPEIYMSKGGFFGAPWHYAVGGYDVVAYFSLQEGATPVEGVDEFTTEYKGVRWRFSSQENLDAFTEDPELYRPQYGGYCAWAVAENKLAKGDPNQWYIHNGKLYLNVNARIKRKWLSDLEAYLVRSEKNWPGILDRN